MAANEESPRMLCLSRESSGRSVVRGNVVRSFLVGPAQIHWAVGALIFPFAYAFCSRVYFFSINSK